MGTRPRIRLGAVSVTLLLLIFGSGCASESRGTAAPVTTAQSTEADEREFFELFNSGISQDYDPAPSPRALAERSTLVVGGTMEEFREGPTMSPREPSELRTVVLALQVESVYKGELPEGSMERVYVRFFSPGNAGPGVYNSALPREAETLLYLIPLSLEGGHANYVGNADAGRPMGQPLWQLTTPQGFLIGFEGDEVVQAADFTRYPATDLYQFLPQNEEYPKPGRSR